MNWSLEKSRPLCPQIYEQICLGIASGEFSAGDRLMSVREVALTAGVNPNTVQRAFENLEKDGILYSQRGSGWYVSDNTDKANEIFSEVIREKTNEYFNTMKNLGFTAEQTKQYIKEWES